MANDSKYGRLYSERAVAPLFALIEGLLLKIVATPTGQRIEVELKDLRAALNAHEDACFPPAEPLFLLRGQDEIAADIVRVYANERIKREKEQRGGGRTVGQGDEETHRHLYEHADRMARWQPRKLPD